jgi:hypothetical protein
MPGVTAVVEVPRTEPVEEVGSGLAVELALPPALAPIEPLLFTLPALEELPVPALKVPLEGATTVP